MEGTFTPREALDELEAIILKMCPEQAVNGLTELPLIALSGGIHSALVAAAINRHLPLRSFTVLLPGEEPPKELEKIVEFLGTTHTEYVPSSAELALWKEEYQKQAANKLSFNDFLLFAAAEKLGYETFYSGHHETIPVLSGVKRRSPLAEIALNPADYKAMAARYLPCL